MPWRVPFFLSKSRTTRQKTRLKLDLGKLPSGKTSNPHYVQIQCFSPRTKCDKNPQSHPSLHLWLRPRWRARPRFGANPVPTFAPRGRTRIGPETRIGPGGVLPRWPEAGKSVPKQLISLSFHFSIRGSKLKKSGKSPLIFFSFFCAFLNLTLFSP